MLGECTLHQNRKNECRFGFSNQVLDEIISQARSNGVDKLIIFGSRARGDYRRTSDIDLAVYGGNVAAMALDIEENVNTLLSFDYVDMQSSVQEELRNSIINEGVVIYEKI